MRVRGVTMEHCLNMENVEFCKRWLERHARKSGTRQVRAYWLKHRIEKDHPFGYVSDDETVAAASELGFKIRRDGNQTYLYASVMLPEDAWKRVRPTGFTRWLKKSDSWLAEDAMNDDMWPRRATSFGDFYEYLWSRLMVGQHVLDEFVHLWAQYTNARSYSMDSFPIEYVLDEIDNGPGEFPLLSFGDEFPDAEEGFSYLYAMGDTMGPYNSRIKYVGQTVSPSSRLTQHIMQPGSIEKLDWIAELRAGNRFPVMVVFDKVPLEEINNKERYAVAYFSLAMALPGQSWRDVLINKSLTA